MNYLFNDKNIVREAVITATNVQPSQAYRRTAATKTGGGRVTLSGDYTGSNDATFDVEVLNDTLAGPAVPSSPSVSGVGNAELSDIAAPSGMPAQEITLTLVDLGTETRKAYAPFQGVTLRAKASGSPGNLITITIDRSPLTAAATSFSWLRGAAAGQNEFTGQEFNFGGPVLNPDDTVPESAPRLRFGDDPQVYRPYQVYRDGYINCVTPKLVRAVPEGARVYAITGGATVTVSNSTIDNVYENITSLFSLLEAIRDDPDALVECVEAVTKDLSISGMATVELSVVTDSFISTVERSGSAHILSAELGLAVAPGAATETVKIECTNNDTPGSEIFAVVGTNSGAIGTAIVGIPFSVGGLTFTLPVKIGSNSAPVSATHSTRLLPYGSESTAIICEHDFRLGAAAVGEKTFSFIWQPRPDDCACDTHPVQGRPDDDILGIDSEGDGMAQIPAALQSRYEDVFSWKSTFVASQVSLEPFDTIPDVLAGVIETGEDTAGELATNVQEASGAHTVLKENISAVLKADLRDVDLAEQSAKTFIDTLKKLYDDSPSNDIEAAALTEWDAAFADLTTELETIDDLIGSDFWRRYSARIRTFGASTYVQHLPQITQQLLLGEVAGYMTKWSARMAKVLVLGKLEPDFDLAAPKGNSVWRDHKPSHWFVSQDGLLPLQLGIYYHSARANEAGTPFSTREFGLAITVCGVLAIGDRLEVRFDVRGNAQVTYQTGDKVTVEIINGAALRLGGGQTGTDTQTWAVTGSVTTGFDPYELNMLSPNVYEDTSAETAGLPTPGLTLKITPRGVPTTLGFKFSFFLEGGQLRWRKNGGTWNSGIQIAPTVALSDGLSAVFHSGAGPSFVAGDLYQFEALAEFGPDRLRQPIDGMFVTYDDTEVVIDRNGSTIPVRFVFLAEHGIDPDAVLTLEGSDDDFATTTFSQVLTWAEGGIAWMLPADDLSLKYRLTSDLPIATRWLYLGPGARLLTRTGKREIGEMLKDMQLPSPLQPKGLGGDVAHTAVSHSSWLAFKEALSHSTKFDQGIFGIFPNELEEECGLVRLRSNTLRVTDLKGFAPRDTQHRWQSFTLNLEPAP